MEDDGNKAIRKTAETPRCASAKNPPLGRPRKRPKSRRRKASWSDWRQPPEGTNGELFLVSKIDGLGQLIMFNYA